MYGDPVSEESDLRSASVIFLRGPVPVGSRAATPVEIGTEAIARVAERLRACDQSAVAEIRTALHWHRRLGTTASRQVVIDAVTAAVAVKDLTDNERSRSR